PWIGKDLQRLQMLREGQPSEKHRNASCEDRQIETPSGEQAEAACDPQDLNNSHEPAPGCFSAHPAPPWPRSQCWMTRRRTAVIDILMTDNNVQTAATRTPPASAIPAATLVIMRRSENGGPDEILMVKRSKTMAFAAGAVVFPGGRIDPDDYLVAAQHGFAEGDIEGAARVAALRET